jgi:hypothetical protein
MDPAHRICKGGRNDPRILVGHSVFGAILARQKAALAEAAKIRPEVNWPARRRKYSPWTAATTKEMTSSKALRVLECLEARGLFDYLHRLIDPGSAGAVENGVGDRACREAEFIRSRGP